MIIKAFKMSGLTEAIELNPIHTGGALRADSARPCLFLAAIS